MAVVYITDTVRCLWNDCRWWYFVRNILNVSVDIGFHSVSINTDLICITKLTGMRAVADGCWLSVAYVENMEEDSCTCHHVLYTVTLLAVSALTLYLPWRTFLCIPKYYYLFFFSFVFDMNLPLDYTWTDAWWLLCRHGWHGCHIVCCFTFATLICFKLVHKLGLYWSQCLFS